MKDAKKAELAAWLGAEIEVHVVQHPAPLLEGFVPSKKIRCLGLMHIGVDAGSYIVVRGRFVGKRQVRTACAFRSGLANRRRRSLVIV